MPDRGLARAPLPPADSWAAAAARAIRTTLAEGQVPTGLPPDLSLALDEVLERAGARRQDQVSGNRRRASDRSSDLLVHEVLAGLRNLQQARIGPSSRHADGAGFLGRISAALDRAAHALGERFAALCLHVDRAATTAGQFDALAGDLKQRSAAQIDSIQAITFNLGSVADLLENSARAATGSLEVAAASQRATEEMIAGVDAITRAIEEIKVATDRNIEFVRIIERIALGTEMLAINASIEAARAGTGSKGFKVIADEVRRLATETKVMAKNIGSTTVTSLNAVENGIRVVSETHGLIGSARNAIDRVTESIGGMHDGTLAQIGKVSALLQEIGGITAFAADNARLAAGSAELGQRQRVEVAHLRELLADVEVHAAIIAKVAAGDIAKADAAGEAGPRPSVELF